MIYRLTNLFEWGYHPHHPTKRKFPLYSVIDTTTLTLKLPDRAKAMLVLEDLQRDNPEAQWEIFKTVEEMNPNVLEWMYALAANLLEMSKANPIEMQLQVYNMDGTETFKDALTIMREARAFIDLCEVS